MVKIRKATKHDWPAISSLIRQYGNALQQDRLPVCGEFIVLQIGSHVRGCCALKDYGEKMCEIRSLAFSSPELKHLYAGPLVSECIYQARKKGTYQLLVTLGKEDRPVFEPLGFLPFNNEKYAMFKWIRGLSALDTAVIPGVVIRKAKSQDHEGIVRLVKLYPATLIQPGLKLFPKTLDFFVALAGGKVVGATALTPFRSRSKKRTEMAEVRSVVVDPEFTKQGIGEQLVTHSINRAIALGVWELLAITGSKNWFAEHFQFTTQRGAEQAWLKVLGD